MLLALVVEAAMEAATDRLHTETETGAPLRGDGQRGQAEEDTGRVAGAESPPRPATQRDDSPACKICSVDDQPGHLPAGEDRPPKDDGVSVPTNPPIWIPGTRRRVYPPQPKSRPRLRVFLKPLWPKWTAWSVSTGTALAGRRKSSPASTPSAPFA
ncbi:hypothetical protein JRQ81_010018 [Phrynocephalus forsythii]|uniref:Uncharacterized protein n=1 Tax=Phrynocephalus forsythii TaxID=171643 RepID=A0A9Q0X9D0_9SAUR|nr:hypothetical protein JRQ81_010018 [Phrynocephalus forsythii]